MSVDAYIETAEQLHDVLNRWKAFSFNEKYINLQDAVDKMETPERLVDAWHQYAPRWMVRPKSILEHTLGSLSN